MASIEPECGELSPDAKLNAMAKRVKELEAQLEKMTADRDGLVGMIRTTYNQVFAQPSTKSSY